MISLTGLLKNRRPSNMDKVKPTHIVLDLSQIPRYLKNRLQKRGGVLVADQASKLPAGPWSDLYNPWAEGLRTVAAKNTVATYTRYVRKFLGNLDGPMSVPTDKQLALFINAADISHETRRTRRASLWKFFGWIENAGYIGFNPVDNVPASWRDLPQSLAVPNPDPPFTQEEVDRMLADTSQCFHFWRWGVALGYYMGLRISDAATVQWGAWGADALHLRTKKTGAVVILPYDHPALGGGIMRQMLAEMNEFTKGRRDPDKMCWPRIASAFNKNPNRLSSRFKQILIKTGVEPRGFQSLRRGCATRCHALGVPLEQIGQFLGHASTDQTKDYIHAPINRSELNAE